MPASLHRLPLPLALVALLIAATAIADDKTADDKTADDKTAAGKTADDSGLFQRLDANGDGQVTADEIGTGQVRLFERLLRTSDKNDDGRLDRAELAAGTQADEAPRPIEKLQSPRIAGAEQVDRLLKQLDANGDGRIAAKEVPEEHRGLFANLKERIDYDKDGDIDRRELAQAGPRLAQMLAARDRIGPGQAEMIFRRTDANRDGKLVPSEVPAERRERFERLLADNDRDDDGAINLQEFKRALGGGETDMPAPPADRDTPRQVGLLPALDTDRDGELSRAEIAAAPSTLRELDRNEDGRLDRGEMFGAAADRTTGRTSKGPQPATARRPERGKITVEQVVQGMLRNDRDGDGKLSRDEAPERMLQFFDQVDDDADGALSRAELKRPASMFVERMQQAGDGTMQERMRRFREQQGQGGDAKKRPRRPASEQEKD